MCILIRSKPPIFQSPQCTRHGKTFDTRISVSWLPDLDSYAVSVGQPGDLNSRISGFSSEVDHGSWSCLGLLLDEYTCRLKSGGLLLTELTAYCIHIPIPFYSPPPRSSYLRQQEGKKLFKSKSQQWSFPFTVENDSRAPIYFSTHFPIAYQVTWRLMWIISKCF